MPTRLIINADDYGRSPDISRGIRDAHLRGMVTSSTCMMNMPGVAQDISIALRETPNLGLGVHLVLTAGRPLLPPDDLPTLTGTHGGFLSQEKLIAQSQAINPDEARAEWQAQVQAFISAAGKKPTHLDSHHHSSYFTPALLQTMLELARDYDLPVRLPIAHRHDTSISGLPPSLAEAMLEFGPQILERFQPRCPDALFTSFYDEGATPAEFLRLLGDMLPNGTFEIMCHPGYVDEAFARESGYAFQRERELKILTDPALRAEVARRGIELISFAVL